MRLLVIGDFSGRPAAERPPLASRPTHKIDVDTLDVVMQRLGPRLQIAAHEIAFQRIDDFHPDALVTRLELFKALRQARTNPPAQNTTGGADDLGRLLGRPAESPPYPLGHQQHRCVDSQYRRAAHRQGHVGGNEVVPGSRGRRDRCGDADCPPRPGVPGAGIGMARRAVADVEPGARRSPSIASVRCHSRGTGGRCHRGRREARADGAVSCVGRPMAERARRRGLVGARGAVRLRSIDNGCGLARGNGADRVARWRAAARWRRPVTGW